jgi:hypothetical protein
MGNSNTLSSGDLAITLQVAELGTRFLQWSERHGVHSWGSAVRSRSAVADDAVSPARRIRNSGQEHKLLRTAQYGRSWSTRSPWRASASSQADIDQSQRLRAARHEIERPDPFLDKNA